MGTWKAFGLSKTPVPSAATNHTTTPKQDKAARAVPIARVLGYGWFNNVAISAAITTTARVIILSKCGGQPAGVA